MDVSEVRRSPTPARTGVVLDRDDFLSRGMLAVGSALARYHRHRIVHLDRLGDLLERGRRVVLVGNHVLDVIDPMLFVMGILDRYGVVPRAMGHGAWFSTPVLRDFSRKYGVVPSRDRGTAAQALREDGLLMLFPGAVREAAIRDFHAEPYRLKWEDRTGFLRLALEEDAEILFFAAVGTEEMYYQSWLPIPGAMIRYFAKGDPGRYRGLRMTFGLFGPHLVPGLFPFPSRITHIVSPALDLGDRARALADEDAFRALHTRISTECQAFLDAAVAEHGAQTSRSIVARSVRAGHAVLRRLGL
jgi:Acyltransferase